MIKCNPPLRIGIFYDGNFLLHTSNYYNYIHPQRRRLSIGGLHSFIKSQVSDLESVDNNKCQIVEAHYFRGRISAAEAAQRGNQLYNDRVFEDILMSEGIQTHYLPLRNFMGKKEERGIDVWLSLEVLESALAGKIDVAVLIISDTDYVPLLRKLDSLGIRTMLLSWEFEYVNDEGMRMATKTSHELLQLATYPVAMHKVIEKGLDEEDDKISMLFVKTEQTREDDDYDETYDQEQNQDVLQSEILSIKNGFGFVKFPNNNLYFNALDVIGDFYDLAPGDLVEFTLAKNAQKQDVAKNVRKIA